MVMAVRRLLWKPLALKTSLVGGITLYFITGLKATKEIFTVFLKNSCPFTPNKEKESGGGACWLEYRSVIALDK